MSNPGFSAIGVSRWLRIRSKDDFSQKGGVAEERLMSEGKKSSLPLFITVNTWSTGAGIRFIPGEEVRNKWHFIPNFGSMVCPLATGYR
jgi:hypothetical protein